MKESFIGVDIGKNGGLSCILSTGEIIAIKVPIVGDDYDIKAIGEFFIKYGLEYEERVHCVIEDVASIFGASAKANFQFGRGLGVIQGIVQSFGIPFTMVNPKVWQKEVWQGVKIVENPTGKLLKSGKPQYKTDTKATSLIACKRLFPHVNLKATERSTKDHDGIVDSLLMAEYCRRKFK